MKNFKLLLASTAILSTGALMANAEITNPTADMNVGIELIVTNAFDVGADMDWGRWVIPSETKSIIFTMDKTGDISTTTSGVTLIAPPFETAYTAGAPCDTLTFPDEVYLVGNNSYSHEEGGEGVVTGFYAVEASDTAGYTCYIFAQTLTVTGEDGENIKSSPYTGSFTITAVLDE